MGVLESEKICPICSCGFISADRDQKKCSTCSVKYPDVETKKELLDSQKTDSLKLVMTREEIERYVSRSIDAFRKEILDHLNESKRDELDEVFGDTKIKNEKKGSK